MPGVAERKAKYVKKLVSLLDEYPCIIMATADFVGGAHMQSIRKELRSLDAVLLMGKNTMVRKVVRMHSANNKALEALVPHIKGNVGFVFCKGNMADVRKVLISNRVGAPAKAGVIAPVNVSVPAGPTGLEPTQTAFLQALNIPTKISRGQIDILKEVQVVTLGEKVGSSEAALLQKLNIKPFTYGLEVGNVYDNGTVYDSAVVELTDDDIVSKFAAGVANIRSISLGLSFPTLAALPAVIMSGYKNVLGIALATKYTYEQVEKIKEIADNPELAAKLAAEAAAAGGGGGGGGGGAAAAAEPAAAAAESESEEEEDADFNLFD